MEGLDMSISEKEYQKRMKLYNKGLNDRKIDEKVEVSRSRMNSWRKRNNLTSNYKN